MANTPALSTPALIINGDPVEASKPNNLVNNSGGLLDTVEIFSDRKQIVSGNSNVTINQNEHTQVILNNTTDITVTINATASSQYDNKTISLVKVGNNTAKATINTTGIDTIGIPWAPVGTPVTTSLILQAPGEQLEIKGVGNVWRPIAYSLPPAVIRFKAQLSTNFSITSSNVIPFNNEIYDTLGIYNTTTFSFVAPFAGVYVASCCLPMSATSIDTFAEFQVNSSYAFRFGGRTNLNAPVDLQGSTALVLQPSDALTVRAAGAGRAVQSATAVFEGYLLSRI